MVDLQHLVTLLLILGGKAALRGRFAAFSETFQAPPLPLHGVSLGLDENEGVLTIEAGATVLSFSLSRGSMTEIGRTSWNWIPLLHERLRDVPQKPGLSSVRNGGTLQHSVPRAGVSQRKPVPINGGGV